MAFSGHLAAICGLLVSEVNVCLEFICNFIDGIIVVITVTKHLYKREPPLTVLVEGQGIEYGDSLLPGSH
jgi:hypothetical protein